MKITLIQTPWSDAAAREFKGVAKKYALYPPLGLMYLAAAVERGGHQAEILDLEVVEMDIDQICRHLKESGTGLIGITTTSPVFHIAQAMARVLRVRTGLPIVVGGAHVTVLPNEAFTEEFDFAVVQEGEETLVELMDQLDGEGRFETVAGLMYRENGQVRKNCGRPFIRDLDSLPFPAREKLDPENYVFEVPGKGVVPVATIELTRGCPFKCVFCSEPLNTGRGLRKRSPANVVDEIELIMSKFGVHHVNLLDSTLTVNRKLIEGFCHELIKRNLGVTWEGHTRANLVDEELLLLMQKAGCLRLTFGVESANTEVLRLMRKEVDPESMRTALKLCKKIKMETRVGLMMGNPGETRQTVIQTALFARSIPEIIYATMSIAIPYPGTELAYMAENNMHGLRLLEKDYSKYSRYAGGVMEVNGMQPEELVRLQRWALFIIHSTPRKMWGLIRHFGFWNVLSIGLKMAKNEVIAIFGGKEPVLNERSVAHDNTTLRNLGVTYSTDRDAA